MQCSLRVVLLLLLLGGLVWSPANIVGALPPREKLQGRRYRPPRGCRIDDYCPEFLGQYHFPFPDYLLPPVSRAAYQMLTRHVMSRVHAISDADGVHVAMWQLRTIEIEAEPEGLVSPNVLDQTRITEPRIVLVPFLLDTAASHVFVGPYAHRFLYDNGALDGASHLALCNVRMPLPHADVRCVRSMALNPSLHKDAARKNVIGGAAAATIIAVQTTLDTARSAGELEECPSASVRLRGSSPAPLTAACLGALRTLSERLLETNPVLQIILNKTSNSPTTSRRRGGMPLAERLLEELRALLDAPLLFDADDYYLTPTVHTHKDGSSEKKGTATIDELFDDGF